MKKLSFKPIITCLALYVFSTNLLAAQTVNVGIVNVTELFNASNYVQKANKKLQENIKAMQEQLATSFSDINNYECSWY